MEETRDRPREVTLRFLAAPGEVNFLGKVHGGSVMKWIDEAAYACATGWSGEFCVTVYVSGIRFYHPVLIGNLIEVHARLIYTGRTSMHIAVDVWSGDPKTRDFVRTTQCISVFVAVDADGRPIPVPAWVPVEPRDVAAQQHALKLMQLREGIEKEMQSELGDIGEAR